MEDTTVTPATAATNFTLVPAGTNKADTLTKEDIRKWAKNTIIFSLPAILVLLTAVQGGVDPKIALGMGFSAMLSSVIDLLRKYSRGV